MKRKPNRKRKRAAKPAQEASPATKVKLRPWKELDRKIFTIDRTVGILSTRR